MKKKGSFVKRAGNYAVFLLKNVWYVLGSILVSLLCVQLGIVSSGVDIDGEWLIVLLVLSIAAVLIGCSILFGRFPFPYTCIWHDFDGCKCRKCGRTRDEGHDFDGCTCRKCGKIRDEGHDFDGCTCRKCGKKIHDHDWQEVSRDTNEVEEEYYSSEGDQYLLSEGYTEEVITYRCRRCGEERTESHKI